MAATHSRILDDLNSKYTCLFEPVPPGADPAGGRTDRRCLTSLRVYGNLDDVDDKPLPTSFSKLLADQNLIDPKITKEKIAVALSASRFREPHLLVQFWSPVTVWNRCLLTTLDQPFGISKLDEGLYLYRRESEQRIFVVDGEDTEDLGPLGRVYCQKLPEWSLDVNGFSPRQNVKDWAASCNIQGHINLPVFEPDNGVCVGVLELVTSSKYVDYAFEVREVSRALKEVNLKSPIVFEDPSFYMSSEASFRNQNYVHYVEHVGDNMEIEPANSTSAGTEQSVAPCFEAGIEYFDIIKGKKRRNTKDKSSNSIKKRKRTDQTIGLEKIRKRYRKTNDKRADIFPVSRSGNHDLAASVLHQPDQTNMLDEHAQPEITITEQFIESNLTIKATYKENMVKFPLRLSDGLVELKKLIAERFPLGSFKLKYKDGDGDMIWITCDDSLMETIAEFRQPDGQTVIRLFVLPDA